MRRLIFSVVVVATALSMPTAVEATTPSFAAVTTALSHQTSVHCVMTAVEGTTTISIVLDGTASTGQQTVTLKTGGTSASATVLLVNKVAYLKGSTAILENYYGFVTAKAKAYGSKWLRIPSTLSYYAGVVDEGSLPALLSTVALVKSTVKLTTSTATTRTWRGVLQKVDVAPTVDENLTVASATNLPLRATANFSQALVSYVFSKWGEAVHVTAPPASTTITATWIK